MRMYKKRAHVESGFGKKNTVCLRCQLLSQFCFDLFNVGFEKQLEIKIYSEICAEFLACYRAFIEIQDIFKPSLKEFNLEGIG